MGVVGSKGNPSDFYHVINQADWSVKYVAANLNPAMRQDAKNAIFPNDIMYT